MWKNYLKIAIRNLRTHRLSTGVSLLGLGLGFYCFLLLGSYVSSERSYDTQHGNVYRLLEDTREESGVVRTAATTGPRVGTAAGEQFAEIEAVTQLMLLGRLTVGNDPAERYYERVTVIDSSFFDVFDFQLLKGSREELFAKPNAMLLTESQARKYFGEAEAEGRSLRTNIYDGEVVAIMRDFPSNTHLAADLLITDKTAAAQFNWWTQFTTTVWHNNAMITYLKLRPDADPAALAGKIGRLAKDNWPADEPFNRSYHLQAVRDVHLAAIEAEGEINNDPGNLFYTKLFGWLALALLLVAAFNFTGLLNVNFLARSREIGVRKVVGAGRSQLLTQVVVESSLLTLLSLLLALSALYLTRPFTQWLLGDQFNWLDIRPEQWLLLVGSGMLIVVFSTIYPALLVSRWRPALIIKSGRFSDGKRWNIRQVATFVQFVIAIGLIACTLLFYRQLSYVQNKSLGFQPEGIVVVDINSGALRAQFQAIKQEFAKLPEVSSVTVSSRVPGEWKNIPFANVRLEGQDVQQQQEMLFFGADPDFLATYDVRLLEGRNFTDRPADSTQVMLNDAAVRALGLSDPVGQYLNIASVNWDGDIDDMEEPVRLQIAGVVADFHFEDIHQTIRPAVIGYWNNPIHNIDYYSLRVNTEDWAGTVASLTAINNRFDADNPLEYTILNDQFQRFYAGDVLRSRLLWFFSAVVIFIACLGLFVMVAFSLRHRTKEIGIRRVLGASVASVVHLVARDFLLIVALAFLLALPAAWLLMRSWLQEFAYRTDMAWWLFGLAGLTALLIAGLTVSVQAVRAALANPVEALKTE